MYSRMTIVCLTVIAGIALLSPVHAQEPTPTETPTVTPSPTNTPEPTAEPTTEPTPTLTPSGAARVVVGSTSGGNAVTIVYEITLGEIALSLLGIMVLILLGFGLFVKMRSA